MGSSAEITALLQLSGAGDREAFDRLFEALYAELRLLAQGQRHRWDGAHTLNATALVHEAYLKLVGREHLRWNDRNHFLAVATRAIRHILINYAECRRAAKRGGGADDLSLDETNALPAEANPLSDEAAEEILNLHEALQRLESVNERQARIVEARFFGGFTIEQSAELLGISPATVKRDWLLASAWLHREIQPLRE